MFCDPQDAEICGSCVLTWVGMSATGVALLCLPMGYWILGRQFDRLVGQGAGPEFWLGPIGRLVMRPLIFAMLIVANPDWEKIERRKGKDRVDNHPAEFFVRDYRGVNYRRCAGPIQTGFSWVYVLSATSMVVLGLFGVVCDWLL